MANTNTTSTYGTPAAQGERISRLDYTLSLLKREETMALRSGKPANVIKAIRSEQGAVRRELKIGF